MSLRQMMERDQKLVVPRGVSRREFLKWAALVGAGTASTMFMGCGPRAEEPTPPSGPEPAKPAPAPEFPRGTMRILQGVDTESMDPHVTTSGAGRGILWSVYEGLGTREPSTMATIPWLAKSVAVLKDDLWELKLRDDVVFHNGERFNAEIVKANIERYADPATGNVYASLLSPVTSVKVVDDYTVQVGTDGPHAVMWEVFCEDRLFMMPMSLIKGQQDPKTTAIGTGAYRFVDWTPGERVVVEATDEHFSDQPRMERIIWRPVPEASTRVIELKTGAAELITNVPAVQVSEIPDNIQSIPVTGPNFIVLNIDHPAMSDVRVRQAMNYAVDKQGMINTIMRGFADITNGPLGVGTLGYDPTLEPYPYDPDKAMQLLRDAGWGQGFDIVLASPDGRYPNDKTLCESIGAQWNAVGINTHVRVMEWGTFVEGVLGRGLDAYFFRQGGTLTDATVRINLHSKATKGGGPWHGYVNEEVDRIIDEAPKSMDADKREAMYKRLNQIVRDDAVWVYLHQYHDIYGVASTVQNFRPRPDGLIVLHDMYMKS